MGPAVDAVLRPAEFALRQPQHSKNVQDFPMSAVRNVRVRFRGDRSVHRRDDSQNAHPRDIESISNAVILMNV